MVIAEEKRVEFALSNGGKNNLFIFREEVKDLLLLLFSLCEYNLRLIFARKSELKLPESPSVSGDASKEM